MATRSNTPRSRSSAQPSVAAASPTASARPLERSAVPLQGFPARMRALAATRPNRSSGWRRRRPARRRWPRRCRSTPEGRRARRRPARARPASRVAAGADRHREHRDRGHRVRQGRRRHAAARLQPRQRAARPGARRFRRPGADHQPGRARSPTTRTRSRRACAGRRCSRTSSCARRSPTSTTSASPSAWCTRAARRRTATSSAYEALGAITQGGAVRRSRQAHAGVRALLDRARRARLGRPARDVRGFAVKFYTDEGNWDLVGNNIPVFFIQDAMKFPDLVHAVKPEPHHQMPQAATAHDTFWDFVSLMPESTHMLHVGDVRPRDPAQLPHDAGLRRAHLPPRERRRRIALRQVPLEAGRRHAFARLGRGGEDHRRRPRLPPPRPLGGDRGRRLPRVGARRCRSSPRSRPSASASTSSTRPRSSPRSSCRCARSAGWCSTATPTTSSPRPSRSRSAPQHVVPGIDFSNDPLLQGRHFSYLDTQLTRLGGPNFHEIPINAPVAQVHNNQRDGFHRQAIPRGRVNYEPNSLGGGCPFQAGCDGLHVVPARRCSRTRCAPSPRSSPTTTPRRRCSGRARRRSSRTTSSARSASS